MTDLPINITQARLYYPRLIIRNPIQVSVREILATLGPQVEPADVALFVAGHLLLPFGTVGSNADYLRTEPRKEYAWTGCIGEITDCPRMPQPILVFTDAFEPMERRWIDNVEVRGSRISRQD